MLGNLHADVRGSADGITVDGDEFKVLSVKDPAQLPWKDLGVDIVLESTGIFTNRDGAAKHLAAGAKKVIITAPAKNPDITVVLGRQRRRVRSGEAPDHLERLVHDQLPGAARQGDSRAVHDQKAWMTTVHSYTNDQNLLDLPHKDLRRARAAALSIIPTTTGAATAVGEVMPELKGKFDGIAMRVPTPNVSVVDLNADRREEDDRRRGQCGAEEAANGKLKGILAMSDEPLVSIDFRGNPNSSIVDSAYTSVMDGDFVKVLSWYDNEWGYSNRCVDLVMTLVKRGL